MRCLKESHLVPTLRYIVPPHCAARPRTPFLAKLVGLNVHSNCETPEQTTALPTDGLSRAFFERDVVEVAQACLGLELEAHTSSGCARGRIVEVEAYRGPDDRAAHSYGGRRTARTEAMFGPPGYAYVFLIYGIHTHVNIVTGAVNEPHAVLIRALEPVSGMDLMRGRRAVTSKGDRAKRELSLHELCNGPGKLCQALDITRRFNGRDLLTSGAPHAAGSNLEYVSLRPGVAPRRVGCSPRIGVDYAGEWASKPWRFFDQDSPFVSRPPRRTTEHHV